MSDPIRLDEQGSETLMYLLENPPPPTPALANLLRKTPLTEAESAEMSAKHAEWKRGFESWKSSRA